MQDVVIIGGGVIGLSTAYELAGRGLTVTVLDAQQPGSEASWAGAGILPPGYPGDPQHPLSALCRATAELWPVLSAELRESTGIDNGFRRCGGIGLLPADASSEFRTEVEAWRNVGVRVEELSVQKLTDYEPSLQRGFRAYRLPDQCQVRNPRHLKALEIGCSRRGVEIRAGQPVDEIERAGERVLAVRTSTNRFEAGSFLVTAGAWSRRLLAEVGCDLPIEPVRGQIVLLNLSRPEISHIIESGPRYLVPRPDGRLLVGSTEEWVGFDKRNTASAVKELLEFAESLVPQLADARFERAWCGLRPHVPDGLPCLGGVPGCRNLFVAAGHFRGGLNLSPITARVMGQLITGNPVDPPIDAFAVGRDPVE
ncbi:MAG: glycine oxidase ThiO [Planctomycetaceae bacterium]